MSAGIDKRLKQAEIMCEKSGVQFTPLRKELLALIYSQKEPLTAYQLLHLFRQTHAKAESMTIYRALDFLQTHHFVHRLASKNTYAACDTPDEHHHAQFLLCEKCEQTQEINAVAFAKAVKKLALEYQFELTNKPIELMGTCKKCSSR